MQVLLKLLLVVITEQLVKIQSLLVVKKAENDLSVAIGNRTEATANAAIAIGT